MDSNGDDDRARIESLLKDGKGRCIICLEEWTAPESKVKDAAGKDQSESNIELVNRLIPCNHLQCNTCFVHYQVKEAKTKCPVCQVQIVATSIINCKTLTESKHFEIKEYFAAKNGECEGQGDASQNGGGSSANPTAAYDDSHLYESFDH